MKKLLSITLLIIVGLTVFTGCSKKSDEDGPSSTSVSKSKLVGKWLYVKFVESGDTETFTEGEYFQFNADGTAYDSMDDDNAQWTLSGSKINFVYNNGSATATVQKLTSSELVLFYQDADRSATAYFKK